MRLALILVAASAFAASHNSTQTGVLDGSSNTVIGGASWADGDSLVMQAGHTVTIPEGATITGYLTCQTASTNAPMVVNGWLKLLGGDLSHCASLTIGPHGHVSNADGSVSRRIIATNTTSSPLVVNGACDNSVPGTNVPMAIFDNTVGALAMGAFSESKWTATCAWFKGINPTGVTVDTNLSTASHGWECTRCVFTDSGQIKNTYKHAAATYRFNYSSIIRPTTSGALGGALTVCEYNTCPASTGPLEVIGSYIDDRGLSVEGPSGVDFGAVLRNTFLRSTVASNAPYHSPSAARTPIYTGDNWNNVALVYDRSSGLNTTNSTYPPGGTLRNTYALVLPRHLYPACGTTTDGDVFIHSAGLDTTYDGLIAHEACANGNVVIPKDGAAPFTVTVRNSFSIPDPNGRGPSLLTSNSCTGGGSSYCPTVVMDHDLIQASDVGNTGIASTQGSVPASITVTNSIGYRATSGHCGLSKNVGQPPAGTYNVDYNLTYNCDNLASTGTAAAWQYSDTSAYTAANPHGIVADPKLLDSSRNIFTYCSRFGHNTIDSCFAAFAPGTSTFDPNMSVEGMIQWVKQGFISTATEAQAASSTGGYVGPVPPTFAPVLLFSDLTDGPRTGGENSKGAYVCVTGRNFGATRGSSTISIGGVNVDNYPVWGSANAPARGDDKACFQLGTSVPVGVHYIEMTVNGMKSNALPFTVRPDSGTDAIYCVTSTGNDSTGTGNFGSCWATIGKAYTTLRNSSGWLLYIKGVSLTTGISDGYLWDTYGYAGGTVNAMNALLGYPGDPGTIGTDSGAANLRAVRIVKDNYVVAGLNLRGASMAVLVNENLDNHLVTNWRLIGNDITCSRPNPGPACIQTAQHNAGFVQGNYVHDVMKNAPHGYMSGSIPTSSGKYDPTDSVLLSVVSDGSACTVTTQNSNLDVWVGEHDIAFHEGPTGLNDAWMTVTAVADATHFTVGCSVAAGTYNSGTHPNLWYTARHKYYHVAYMGTDSTNYDIGWNEFSNNIANLDIDAYAEPYFVTNPRNSLVSARSLIAPQALLATDPQHTTQPAYPSMTSVSGCSSGVCTGDRTYYVSMAWQDDSGIGPASHETAITVPAGQLLRVTSPPTTVTTCCGNGYSQTLDWLAVRGTNASPTNWCVYVATSPGGTQQSCPAWGTDWTEPNTSITTTGAARLDWQTQTGGTLGGYSGSHVKIHDNLIHGGAGAAIIAQSIDPTPTNLGGDAATGGGAWIFNNVVYDVAQFYYHETSPWIGPWNWSNPYVTAACIATNSQIQNGPTQSGSIKVENNTCYNIGKYYTPAYAPRGVIYNISYNDGQCKEVFEANNNLFLTSASTAINPWITAQVYDYTSCANSLKGQKNVWYNTSAPTTKPPDAAAVNGDSSCVTGGVGVGKSCFTNSVTADPLFTNAASGDFSLQATSTVKSGGVTTVYPTTDFYGAPRAAYSLGAIEYGAQASPPACSIAPTSIGPYAAGNAVSQTFTASNCTSSTWGSTGLPCGGLSLNSSTGVLSGTATAATCSVTITYDTASQAVSYTVNAAPSTAGGAVSAGATVSAGAIVR